MAIEGVLFATSVIARHARVARRARIGRWAPWGLVGLPAVIWLSGPVPPPPPPSAAAVMVVAVALWLFPPWGTWIARHHRRRSPGVSG